MPIYPGEMCPICGENPNITFICDDCRETFCDDCVDIEAKDAFVCSDCGDTNVLLDEDEELLCGNCNSYNIKNTRNLISICPHCEGTNVIKIETKQKGLLARYKDIINNARVFLEPLENTLVHLNEMKQSLIELRDGGPKCHHHPNCESELLLILKLYNNAKSNIYDEVNKFFQEVQRNIHYVSEITTTHPANLPYINEILNLFDNEHRKVNKFSKGALNHIQNKIEALQEKIDFMENMQQIFKRFSGQYSLDNDEYIVYGIECKLSSGENDSDNFSRKKGTILITSKRIHFLHERGVFNKRTVRLFSVKLEDLQEIEIKGTLTKKVSLDFVNSMYQFKLSKEKRITLIDWIKKARVFEGTNYIDQNKLRKLRKYKITTKMFRNELESAIYELVGFHGSETFSVNDYARKTNQMVNAEMYRNTKLGQRPIDNSGYSARESNARMAENVNQQWKFNQNPLNNGSIPGHSNEFPFQKTTQRGRDTRNLGSQRQDSFSAKTHIRRSKANKSSPLTPRNNQRMRKMTNNVKRPWEGLDDVDSLGQEPSFNRLRNSGSFSGNSRNNRRQYTRNSQFGFPPSKADRDMESNSSQGIGKNFNEPFPGNRGEPNNPFKDFPGLGSTDDRGLGVSGRQKSDPFGDNGRKEHQLRTEVQKLKQEEFALKQTLSMLEDRFDTGYMDNMEFLNSYREMQREMYKTRSKIEKLEDYIQDHYVLYRN